VIVDTSAVFGQTQTNLQPTKYHTQRSHVTCPQLWCHPRLLLRQQPSIVTVRICPKIWYPKIE